MKLVLTGDSITAAGRDLADPTDLGTGYAARVAARLAAARPGLEVRNTGINGNRVPDLQERWERDVLDHAPDTVSLMVGVNDMWRRYTREQATPVARFEAGYRDLLRRTRAAGVERIIVLEPFLLPVRDEQWSWRADLDEKIAAVRRLAGEFEAELVATDGPFAQAGSTLGASALVCDGVHPTDAGHDLLAQLWLAVFDPVRSDHASARD